MNAEMSDDQDWRLQAELDHEDARRALHDLLGRLRGPALVKEVEASVPHDVVVTHDGSSLFAYASEEATIRSARDAIAATLEQDGIRASLRISHWDDERDSWRQTDPPMSAEQQAAEREAERSAETVETRTMVATSGKSIRTEFEQTMLDAATRLGLECKVVEHPHLLSTQVAFTVTGPKGKVDEFARDLAAEGWSTVRTETAVMLSPL